jgi:hypothetical protein
MKFGNYELTEILEAVDSLHAKEFYVAAHYGNGWDRHIGYNLVDRVYRVYDHDRQVLHTQEAAEAVEAFNAIPRRYP